jgi:hypothetical protein
MPDLQAEITTISTESVNLTPSPYSGVTPPVANRFKPGQSGNPAGRPAAGARVIEAWHNLADKSVQELTNLVENPNTGWARKVAAQQMLKALDAENDPEQAGRSADRVLDRTVGKPTQAITVDNPNGAAFQIQAQAQALIAGVPLSGLQSLIASLSAALPAPLPENPPCQITSEAEIVDPEGSKEL